MEYKNYKQFRVGFGYTDIESDVIDNLQISINSNEPTAEIINGSDKFTNSMTDILIDFINKVNEVQLDRKSNYVFIECVGSGKLHHAKATLSCKITKKTAQELRQDEERDRIAEYQRKHAETTRISLEKRKATIEAKKAAKLATIQPE